MTDSDPTPEPSGDAAEPTPESAEPVPTARKRRDPLPLLLGIGLIVLAGGVVFLWRHPLWLNHLTRHQEQTAASNPAPAAPPPTGVPTPQPQPAGATPAPVPPPETPPAHAEAQPAPPPANPAPETPQPATEASVVALTRQVQDLQQRLDTLEHQAAQAAPAPPPPDLSPLTQRIEALEKRVAQPPADAKAMDELRGRVDALTAQQNQSEAKQAAADTALASRLAADEARLQQAQQGAAQISARAERLARLQAAAAALAAGQPLGDLPDAPPALARYRSEAPPTEASLRLAFPDLAAGAEAASRPDTGRLPFWQAVRARAESLVTVRRGDEVLVGDPAAGTIARAREALDAGDLAGAVAAISTLSGAPAQVFADWLAHAKALLDARAALAGMALHA